MTDAETSARQLHAANQWAALLDRVRTITPQAVGRTALAVAAVGGTLWLAAATWPSLLPFVVGGLIAYQLLPLVDWLDRVMPRFLAASISVLAAVAVVIGALIIVVPPLAGAFVRFAVDLPSSADIDAALARLQEQLGALPEGSAGVVVPVLTTLASTVRDVFAGAGSGLDDVVRAVIAGLLNALGALLGLIVLPTWMLMLMSQKQRARLAIDTRITPGLRPDLWAVVAIVDRAAGAYLRGYIVTGFLVGLVAYILTILSPRIGGPTFSEPLAVATFAGATQVVPIVGPILGLLPALLILPISPERAVIYLVVYFVARYVGGSLLGSRLMGRRLGVHPAILVPAVVMIGQFGVLWLLLSAPIVAIAADLVRYVHGRLSEPAKPAGVLPRTEEAAVAGAPSATGAAVPSVYRPATAPPPLGATVAQPAPPTT
ncbi:MAG TPA: AI-2E family transporter [Candidatus Limnocylindrales bacterium]|nr:AI-2E family transporter [Candidatus Limnocylindrales bacterium]